MAGVEEKILEENYERTERPDTRGIILADAEVAKDGDRSGAKKKVVNKKPHGHQGRCFSASIKNVCASPRHWGWELVGGGGLQKEGLRGARAVHSGGLPHTSPEVLRMQDGSRSRKQMGGCWEPSSFGVLLLPEETAMKSCEPAGTGCLQSLWEGRGGILEEGR